MALRIDPAALGVAYSPDTPSKAMHVLFEIARSYGLRPEVLDDGTIALLMDSPRRVFCQALLSHRRHGFVSHFPSPGGGCPMASVTTK